MVINNDTTETTFGTLHTGDVFTMKGLIHIKVPEISDDCDDTVYSYNAICVSTDKYVYVKSDEPVSRVVKYKRVKFSDLKDGDTFMFGPANYVKTPKVIAMSKSPFYANSYCLDNNSFIEFKPFEYVNPTTSEVKFKAEVEE